MVNSKRSFKSTFIFLCVFIFLYIWVYVGPLFNLVRILYAGHRINCCSNSFITKCSAQDNLWTCENYRLQGIFETSDLLTRFQMRDLRAGRQIIEIPLSENLNHTVWNASKTFFSSVSQLRSHFSSASRFTKNHQDQRP